MYIFSTKNYANLQYYKWYLQLYQCDLSENSIQGWVSRGLTSNSTLYRSFRGQFLQVRWPNQQHQSTKGSQLAAQISFNPIRTTPLCDNIQIKHDGQWDMLIYMSQSWNVTRRQRAPECWHFNWGISMSHVTMPHLFCCITNWNKNISTSEISANLLR